MKKLTKARARTLCRKVAGWIANDRERYLCVALDQLLVRTSATVSEVVELDNLLAATFQPDDTFRGGSWWRPEDFSIRAADECREARIIAILLLPEFL